MGKIVNRIADVAVEWQQHIIWIRINIAYIMAELPHLSESGEDISDIKALMDSFDSAFEQFYRNELETFAAARGAEIDDKGKNELVNRLRRMKESLSPCIFGYNEVIEARKTHDPLSLTFFLLTSCGAELLNAFSRFVDVIDVYIGEID